MLSGKHHDRNETHFTKEQLVHRSAGKASCRRISEMELENPGLSSGRRCRIDGAGEQLLRAYVLDGTTRRDDDDDDDDVMTRTTIQQLQQQPLHR